MNHAIVGFDWQGDACIFVQNVDENGEHINYLSKELLQVIADWLNQQKGWTE